MKVRVLSEKCRGHAMCMLACPEVFQLDDESGHAFVPNEDVPAEFTEAVAQAARSCPEEAIEVSG